MLAELQIRNLGLVEQATLPFAPGLNALTGETGAGKSIIVEALDLALGGRASAEAIRTGEEKASVGAFFTQTASLADRLREAGVIAVEDDLLLQRELTRSGRNTCRINGQMVPLALYREAGRILVDMHGQHEQHRLAVPSMRLHLVDRFGGPPLLERLNVLQEAFAAWREAAATLERLAADERDVQRQLEEWEHFLADMERLAPRTGEEKELAEERLYLGSREKIASLLFGVCQTLNGDGRGRGLTDLVGRVAADLKTLAELERRVEPQEKAVGEAACLIQEAALELAALQDRLEFDPLRLAAIEERLDLYTRARRRYGCDGDALVARMEEARRETALLQERLTGREEAARQEEKRRREYEEIAAHVGALRREAARGLEGEVTGRLRALEMERVVFQVEFGAVAAGPLGCDAVDFLLSPNRGEPLRPLNRIASGGELSRIMLALKAVLADADETPVLVFDEVDAGIGGRALTAVADSLVDLAGWRQVIVVTHAAQVASRAASHIHIFKEEHAGRTRTRALVLEGDRRVDELTRMLGDAGAAARDHALALLAAGRAG